MVMAVFWAGLARRIEAMGERLVPWIMTLNEPYILVNTGADALEGACLRAVN